MLQEQGKEHHDLGEVEESSECRIDDVGNGIAVVFQEVDLGRHHSGLRVEIQNVPVEKSEELKAQTGFGKVSENEHYSVRHLETDYQNNYEFDLNPSFILFQVEVSNCVDYERRCDNKSKIQYEKDEADQQFAQINDSELLEEC